MRFRSQRTTLDRMTTSALTTRSISPFIARAAAAAAASTLIAAGAVTGGAVAAHAATSSYSSPGSVAINDRIAWVEHPGTIAIPTQGPAAEYPSMAAVANTPGTITDVDVTLKDLTHDFTVDLDVLLVGPHGQQAVLMSDTGSGFDVAGQDIVFDDEAAASVSNAIPLTSGSYRPTNIGSGDIFPAPAPNATSAGSSLSVFDGTDPDGTWQLFVLDDSADDAGSVGTWTVRIETSTTSNPYPAELPVTGASGAVVDVDLGLHDLSHSYWSDMDVMLVAPDGRRALVMSDSGNYSALTHQDVVLDDEAAAPLPALSPVVSGTYQPTNNADPSVIASDDFPAPAPGVAGIGSALSVFDGINPNGTWKLFITDDASGDTGVLAGGWSLHITTTDPAPTGTPSTTPAPTTPTPTTSPSADTANPRVASTAPKAGAGRVARSANLTATFTENMRATSLSTATVKLVRKGSTKPLAAKVTYNKATRTVTVDPAAALRAGTTYKVIVTTRAKDIAGNALDQKPAKDGHQRAKWIVTTR